ncbi:MAG: SIR2 family NAD-dependent protein deacylase [Promethearchaeota archaeon]
MDLKKIIHLTADWIIESKNVVIFTGAGISTASGLPDYRGPDGVWTRRDKGLPPPAYKVHPDKIKPNIGHQAIVELKRLGKVDFLISQNVDGLHLISGFPQAKIAELHGNKHYMVCLSCNQKYNLNEIGWNKAIHGNGYRTSPSRPGQPRCPKCGGRIISSIVNFNDPMPEKELDNATRHSKLCDLFIVLGSSLVVNPAAKMAHIAKKSGARIIINNLGETPYDSIADLLVPFKINEYFPPVVDQVKYLLECESP